MSQHESQTLSTLSSAADAHGADARGRVFTLLYGELQRFAQQQLNRMGAA